MSDYPAPVAQNVNPVGQGLTTLSSLLNVKQQQQGIQLNQQALASGAADVQQKQQAMQERLAVQQMMKTGVDDKGQSIIDASGNPDPTKVLPALGRIAPLTGQQYAQGIIKTQTDRVGLQAASANLDANERGMLMGPVQAAAVDPNAKSADINAGIDNLVSAHPEMANAATYLKGLTTHIDVVPPPQRAGYIQSIAAHMQPGQGVQTQPTAGAVNTGAVQSQGTFAPPVAGGGFTPATQVTNQPGPTQTPAYQAAVASSTARATGVAGNDVDRGNQVSGLQQQSSAAIPLTQRIDELARDINSGKVAKMVSETGNYFGLSSINEARSQLNKDLGQVKGLAIQNAGSDSRAGTILEGYPTDTTPENTIHAAMDYIRGSARQNLARGQLLSQYQKADPSLRGFQAADTILTGTSNPLMHEFMALPPAQRAGFYQRNFSTPQEAQSFKDQVTALQKHTNGIVSGQ